MNSVDMNLDQLLVDSTVSCTLGSLGFFDHIIPFVDVDDPSYDDGYNKEYNEE